MLRRRPIRRPRAGSVRALRAYSALSAATEGSALRNCRARSERYCASGLRIALSDRCTSMPPFWRFVRALPRDAGGARYVVTRRSRRLP
jgi:hypothetical protein